jgi:hypothetical protein
MKSIAQLCLIGALALATSASASVITFESGTYTNTPTGGNIATSADATFSHNRTWQWEDGFQPYFFDGHNGALSWYGLNGQDINFTGPVTVNSIELATHNSFYVPDPLMVNFYDASSALIASVNVTLSTSVVLHNFNVSGVSQISFDWSNLTGDLYGDGRNDTAWYFIDNLTYNTARVPDESSTFALLAGAILLLRLARRR